MNNAVYLELALSLSLSNKEVEFTGYKIHTLKKMKNVKDYISKCLESKMNEKST